MSGLRRYDGGFVHDRGITHLSEDEVLQLLLVGDERITVKSNESLLVAGVDVVALVHLFVTLLPN